MEKDQIRNIPMEYKFLRRDGRAPFIVPEAREDIIQELQKFGVITHTPPPDQPIILQFHSDSILVTSLKTGFMIHDETKPEGFQIIGDRLIVSRRENTTLVREGIQLLRHLRSGNLEYHHFKRGRYGVVLLDLPHNTSVPMCIKLFNYAVPFSKEEWDKAKKRKFKPSYELNTWNLSGVTGIGSFVAHQEIRKSGIPMPRVFVATNEVLIQEEVPGFTIGEIIDQYEVLKSQGKLGDNDEIIDTARSIIGNTSSPVYVCRKLMKWVNENIKKMPVMVVPSALDVLHSRVGDCNEHATLLTALLRAVGIPSRISVGLVYSRNRFYYHAWNEAYVGEWITMDPTMDQMPADPTHIKLAEGNLDQQISIAPFIGSVKFELLNYEYD